MSLGNCGKYTVNLVKNSSCTESAKNAKVQEVLLITGPQAKAKYCFPFTAPMEMERFFSTAQQGPCTHHMESGGAGRHIGMVGSLP